MVPRVCLSQCPSVVPLSLLVLTSILNAGLVRAQTINPTHIELPSDVTLSGLKAGEVEEAEEVQEEISLVNATSSDQVQNPSIEERQSQSVAEESLVWAQGLDWCQRKVSLAVETAAIQTKPAYAGYRDLDLSLVRDGGLRLCSREFDSLGLKLTQIKERTPLQCSDQPCPPASLLAQAPSIPDPSTAPNAPTLERDAAEPPSQEPLETPAPTPLPPPEELLQSPPSAPPTPPPIPGRVPETITITKFEFEGNTAISDEELAKETERFTNRAISFAELFEARSAVTQLYFRRGYITSGALIPPQTLDGGVVTIQIVEGGLEAINVTGTQRLRPEYVRSRIAIATEKPLNRDRLLEALQLLQLNPLIQNLSAELAAGTEPGSSVLEVRVTEADTFGVQIAADNNSSPSIGTFNRQIQVGQANLLGFGDGISIGLNNTNGSTGVDLSYIFPLNPRNGTLEFSFGATSSNVIEPPFDRLDIEANSRYYELSLRQPVFQTPTQEFAVGVTVTRQESKTSLFEIPFPLSPGADDDGSTRISVVRLFQEWTKRTSREVIAARSQFSIGVNLFNATTNEEGPDSRFYSWRGQAQWVRLLAPETIFLLRGDVQLANRGLLALEQFGLGGQETIRGYRQDVLLTDNGVLLSAEARIPVLRISEWDTLVQVAPFIDFGAGWNNSGRPDPDPGVLASIGLGLQVQVGNFLSIRLDYGIPFVSVFSSDRTLQENGFYFSVVATPF